jgi:NAD(P)H dehydrogenase (quinone)
MAKVLVIYATDYGNTKKMAEEVVKGIKSVNQAQAVLKEAEAVTADDCLQADALIIGTPVHMGSPDWRIKKFIDKVCSGLWMKDLLIGKIGGVFASGSGFGNGGGGAELAMLALLTNFAELGMLIIPLPKNTPGYHLAGLQWGPYGRSSGSKMEQTGIPQDHLETSFHHGANIARLTHELKSKGHLFAHVEPSQAKS